MGLLIPPDKKGKGVKLLYGAKADQVFVGVARGSSGHYYPTIDLFYPEDVLPTVLMERRNSFGEYNSLHLKTNFLFL